MIIMLTGPLRYHAMYAVLQEALTVCGGHGVFGLAASANLVCEAGSLAYETDRTMLIQSRKERIKVCDVVIDIDVELAGTTGGQAQIDCDYAQSLGKRVYHLMRDRGAIQELLGIKPRAMEYASRLWDLQPSQEGRWGIELTCLDPAGLRPFILNRSAPMHVIDAYHRVQSIVPQAREVALLGWIAQVGAAPFLRSGVLSAVNAHHAYEEQIRRAPLMTGQDYVALVRPYREITGAGLRSAVQQLDDAEWDLLAAVRAAKGRGEIPLPPQSLLTRFQIITGSFEGVLDDAEGTSAIFNRKTGDVRIEILGGGYGDWVGLTFERPETAQWLAAKQELTSTRPNMLVVTLSQLYACLEHGRVPKEAP